MTVLSFSQLSYESFDRHAVEADVPSISRDDDRST